jgi:penicillin-binding protein 1C
MLKLLSRLKIWQWAAIFLLLIVILYLTIPPSKPLFSNSYSTIINARNGELLHAFLNNDEQWHFPPDTSKIPQKLKSAAIAFEDENFYKHFGVSISALTRAAYQNYKQGKIVSGASTIPMQIARMRKPKKRTYLNKALEIAFAIKLDLHFSKDELLSLYLNHAPYGGNVIGYRTASLKFFGKEPNQLTWSEAATLAVLPNAPGLIYPTKTSDALMRKRNGLLRKLFENAIITEQTYQLALLEPIPNQFIIFESHAPHLAQNLKKKQPNTKSITTTIDLSIQQQCNRIAQRHAHKYEFYGIHNLAILVADTKTGEIRAYIGSPNFFDFNNGGQVDGVLAARSSGSILKPFLYALSIDEGLITPESLIRDLPTFFDGFSPKNASREYQGVARAKDALVQSLNIPAVRLLNSYGVFQFYTFLKEAGVSTLFRSADEYGLPLILGGAEVSLWDMVSLYRGLANQGIFTENTVIKSQSANSSMQLISTGGCYLTLEMLKDLKRPGSEYFWERFSGSRPFAWKTGTSYGHKDAWAIGVNPEYTIAVWVGNFNGDSNKNLSGAISAGPILFDILQSLPHKSSRSWFEKDEIDFKQITICKLSGFRATDACTQTDTIDVPYGMKPLKACDYHEFRYFSTNGKYQSCSRCWHLIGNEKKSVTIYPPDIAFYLREKGQYIEKLANHYPKCPAFKADNSLKIIYPNMDAKLFLPRDFNGKTQPVICKAGHTGMGKKVYWYLDDVYLGVTTHEHKMAVIFNQGWNTLKVIDEFGAEDMQRVFATLKE